MKKIFLKSLIWTMAMVAIVFTACQKEETTQPDEKLAYQDEIDFLVNNYGFDKKDIDVMDSFLVVEGDMVFPIREFWEKHGKEPATKFTIPTDSTEISERKHYRKPYLVTTTSVVTVNVMSTVPVSWKNAILQAIDKWNSLGNNLTFTGVCSQNIIPGAVNVGISYNFPASSILIAGTEPPSWNGNPGSIMLINNNYNYQSTSKKLHAMVHELGHTIGFLHTDAGGQGSSLINNVSFWCKTFSDSQSVMRDTNKSWSGFSSCDIEAFFALY